MVLVEINSFLVNLIFSFNENGFVNGSRHSIERQSYDDLGSEPVTKIVILITSFSTTRQENTLGKLVVRTGIPFGLTLRDMESDCNLLAIFSTFQDQDHLLVQDYGFFMKTMSTGKPIFEAVRIKVTNLAPLVPSIDQIVVDKEEDQWGNQIYRDSIKRLQARLEEFKLAPLLDL